MKTKPLYIWMLSGFLILLPFILNAQTPQRVCIYVDETCQTQCTDQVKICFIIGVEGEGDCVTDELCVSFIPKTTYCFFMDECVADFPTEITIFAYTKDLYDNECCCGYYYGYLYSWSGSPAFTLDWENCPE